MCSRIIVLPPDPATLIPVQGPLCASIDPSHKRADWYRMVFGRTHGIPIHNTIEVSTAPGLPGMKLFYKLDLDRITKSEMHRLTELLCVQFCVTPEEFARLLPLHGVPMLVDDVSLEEVRPDRGA